MDTNISHTFQTPQTSNNVDWCYGSDFLLFTTQTIDRNRCVRVCVYYAMVFCDVWRWWWWWFSMMMANNDEPHFFSLKFCNSHSVHIGSCVRVSESKVNVRPIELLIRKASSPYVMWMMNNGSGYTSKIHRNKEEKKKNTKRNLTATPNTRTHQTR